MAEIRARTSETSPKFLTPPEGNFWKHVLFEMLPYHPHPLLASTTNNISAAALWSYIKVWKEAFRMAKAEKGHVILIALEPSPAWVIVLLTAFWEDITVALCHPDKIGEQKLGSYFGIISEVNEISTWTPGPDLYPKTTRSPNHEAPNHTRERILFVNETEHLAITDETFAKLLRQIPRTNKGESVLSTLDWSNPIGFYYDFFLSFFKCREIFIFPQKIEQQYIQLFNQYEIDHLVCEQKQLETIFDLKKRSAYTQPFASCMAFEETKNLADLLLFLDGNLTFPDEGNFTI